MHRYQPIYAAGVSSGLTTGALFQLLAGVNWPSLLALAANAGLSLWTWHAARQAARREETRRRRMEAELFGPRPCVEPEGRDRIACRHRCPD
jgi:membrane protein implicated in regulation of membrane protease activity